MAIETSRRGLPRPRRSPSHSSGQRYPLVCGPAFDEAAVEAERSRAESDDLQQSARHHDVLQEVDHLILIGEMGVKRHRRRQGKQRQSRGNDASLETG